MKEKAQKQKADKQTDGGAFGGPFDQQPGPANVATVKSGQYLEQLPVGGMTVKEVRSKYSSQMNIHGNAVSIINKKQVDDNTVVEEGQVLTFIHKSGEKGERV